MSVIPTQEESDRSRRLHASIHSQGVLPLRHLRERSSGTLPTDFSLSVEMTLIKSCVESDVSISNQGLPCCTLGMTSIDRFTIFFQRVSTSL